MSSHRVSTHLLFQVLLLWSLRFLQLTVKRRGPVKTHGWPTQIQSISCSRRSLLPLFAQEGIMNDSEWWNGRSLQSSDFNIEGPARTNFRLGNEMDVNKDRGLGGTTPNFARPTNAHLDSVNSGFILRWLLNTQQTNSCLLDKSYTCSTQPSTPTFPQCTFPLNTTSADILHCCCNNHFAH